MIFIFDQEESSQPAIDEELERKRANARLYYRQNAGKAKRQHQEQAGKKKDRDRRAENDRNYERKLENSYGFSTKLRRKVLLRQGEACGICNRLEKDLKERLRVDHDHVTGAVRGLLCNDCNLGLGRLGDTLERVQNAMDYLRRAKAREDQCGFG